jgi:Family of unknown function (DUF6600)/FecR protein
MGPTCLMVRAVAPATVLFVLNAVSGFAQDAARTEAPAHLEYVDGAATLEREGQAETAAPGTPFVPGDRLQTTRGRVEVLFPDGSALAVDEFTTIELQDRALIRMAAGRVQLTVAGVNDPANASRYQIDTPAASAATDGPGEYRVSILNGRGEPETELAVLRGYAALATDLGSTAARAGERILARDALAPSQPLPFNSARFDALDRWASARRDARLGTASSRYLPHDLYAYSSTFDHHGAWNYQAPYGNVWYPTVAPGWQPYFYGYWSPVPAYGWTWVGYDAWAWPTHHYGRWGFAAGRWFWVPGTTWGSAWVSWAAAPGYVGWCPVGYCGGSGFSFGVSFGSPWGWVVVSTPYFGHGYRYPVHHHAIPPTTIPPRTPFVVQARAPLAPPAAGPHAIPRPPAGGPGIRASAQPATGRQPVTAPGVASSIAPNQPELGGARAVPRAQPSAAGSSSIPNAPTAGPRSPYAGPRERTGPADANVNRYVPDTRTLGGRPASAVPRQVAVPAPIESVTAASPRWYPPATAHPRQTPVPGAETPPAGYRAGPVQRAQPSTTMPVPNYGAAPLRAQPRPSAGAPPPSAFQAPRGIDAPPRSFGALPASFQSPGAPMAVPRAPAPSGAPQSAPAQPASPQPASPQPASPQPASPPAGARSPRSR